MSEPITPEELNRLFPNASRSTLKANRHAAVPAGGEAPGPEPELPARPEPLGPVPRKKTNTTRFLIRIESRRRRLLDDDNLCGKYFTDCCRYSGLIPDDAPGICKIETFQTLVATEAEEATVIEIVPLEATQCT